MKEDVLEQVVDDYLQLNGYFTMHNIRFRPARSHPDYVSKDDSVHSDLDVLGVCPTVHGPARVVAVSCKSWQAESNPADKPADVLKASGAAEEDRVRVGNGSRRGQARALRRHSKVICEEGKRS